jgi:hypothetical protein
VKRGAPRFVILLAVLGGLAAVLLVPGLTESPSPNLTPVKSRPLVQRVVEGIRVVFVKKPPQLSQAELHEQLAQEPNEGVGPTEYAAPGAKEAQLSSIPPTRPAALGDLVVFTNTMAYRGVPKNPVDAVTEPTVAMNGKRVLLTWNWGAAASQDGGRTFPQLLDPNKLEKRPGSDELLSFCCDQLAYHVPSTGSRPELWFWVVQSNHETREHEARRDQVVRLQWLVGKGPFDLTTFSALDYSARSLSGLPDDYWLDQPRIAATQEHVFIAVNMYDSSGRDDYQASYVIRLSAADLASGWQPPQEEILKVGSRKSGAAGLVGFSSGATDTMYFAGPFSRSRLRVWKWPDDSKHPDGHTLVKHEADGRQRDYDCRRKVPGARRTVPRATVNWCGRDANGGRVLTGWVAKGIVGFAWNAPANPEAGFRYPYVHVVQLDEGSLELHDEPSILLNHTAVNYAALVPNGRGEIGGVVLLGGGDSYEKCAAVTRDPRADDRSVGWARKVVDASDGAPQKPSGDYLGATTTTPGGNVWAATCMTFHGHDHGPHPAEVRFATFGRAEDRPG